MKMPTSTVLRASVLVLSCLVPTLAAAQNCALCYTQAAASGSRMIQALRSGILMLVIPPMLICVAITWMAYKKRNQFNEDFPSDTPDPDVNTSQL